MLEVRGEFSGLTESCNCVCSDQKIDMTVPVMMTHSEGETEMCFYLTAGTQADPPQPTSSSVYLSRKPDMSGYATTMGGYPNMEAEARKLKAALRPEHASQTDFSSYIAMSFDNPWKIMNRRNDVMYKKL